MPVFIICKECPSTFFGSFAYTLFNRIVAYIVNGASDAFFIPFRRASEVLLE